MSRQPSTIHPWDSRPPTKPQDPTYPAPYPREPYTYLPEPRPRATEDAKMKLQKLSVKELEKVPQYAGDSGEQTIAEYWQRLNHLIEAAFEMPQNEYEKRNLKANVLLTKVCDPARTHLDNNLTQDQRKDFREIIKELEKRYEHQRDEYYYKNQLASLPDNGKIPFVELTGKIELLVKNLVKVTMKDMEEGSNTYKTIFETYAKQWVEEKMNKPHLQFIKMQNKNLSYQNLKEEGARMEEVFKNKKSTLMNQVEDLLYGATANPQEKPEACKHYSKPLHAESECWTKFPDKRPRPTRQQDTAPPPANAENRKRQRCDFCGRSGHSIRDCHALAKYSKIANEEREAMARTFCDNCKRHGHETSRCRNRTERPASHDNNQQPTNETNNHNSA